MGFDALSLITLTNKTLTCSCSAGLKHLHRQVLLIAFSIQSNGIFVLLLQRIDIPLQLMEILVHMLRRSRTQL